MRRESAGEEKRHFFQHQQKKVRNSPKDDGAGVLARASRKVHRPVVADHDLLDEVAAAEAHTARVVEGGGDLSARGRGEALDFLFYFLKRGRERERERGGQFSFSSFFFQRLSLSLFISYLDPVEIGVLDRQDPGVREQLLGEVVDQLPVDKGVHSVPDDFGDLLKEFHLFLILFFFWGVDETKIMSTSKRTDFSTFR